MKSFEEYNDGDWVVMKKDGHPWHLMQFQAYKSSYTHDAFRLKYGSREYVADISEIEPLSAIDTLIKNDWCLDLTIPQAPSSLLDLDEDIN